LLSWVLRPYQPRILHAFGVSRYAHNKWAAKHPGCCAEKETLPWSGEKGDPLGVRLWNVSGGKVKYQPYQVKALRNTGLTDDQIATAFEEFVTAEQARREEGGWHGHWGAVQAASGGGSLGGCHLTSWKDSDCSRSVPQQSPPKQRVRRANNLYQCSTHATRIM